MVNIQQKLQLIKQLSGLTQEKLAQKLGVSFVTFNSWIKARSIPHKNKQKEIDELLNKYTGQKGIPENVLQIKKNIIKGKSKKYKNIIKKIINRSDIYDQLTLSLTYNSNSIEGSTLTENETSAILFQNASLSNKNLIEHLEAKNHQTALKFLFEQVCFDFKINEEFILELHKILMNSIQQDAGQYRNHGVRIVGANIPTANYLKIPEFMKKLVNDINKKEKDALKHIAQIHSQFEQIHPFSDGNGRIGRLLIHAMLLRKKLPPAMIKQKDKRFYYSYLNKAQQKNDSSLLEDFLCDAVLEGFKIVE